MKSNSPQRRAVVLPSICVCTSKRPQVKMAQNLNVPELVKTFPLKRLQLITDKIGRNLIIYLRFVLQSVCGRVCLWTLALFSVSRIFNKPSLVDSHFLYFICFTYSELSIHIRILKQKLLRLKYMICLIWFFTSHQQSFSYIGTGILGLNQY